MKLKDVIGYYKVPQSTVANIIRRGRKNNISMRRRKQKLSDRDNQNFSFVYENIDPVPLIPLQPNTGV